MGCAQVGPEQTEAWNRKNWVSWVLAVDPTVKVKNGLHFLEKYQKDVFDVWDFRDIKDNISLKLINNRKRLKKP